jgi:Tol biopolymer transport system component
VRCLTAILSPHSRSLLQYLLLDEGLVLSLISKVRPIAAFAIIVVCSCAGPTDATTASPRSAWLVFSTTIAGVDPDLNGFTASIDEKQLRVVPSGGQDSVEVSAGKHQVRFTGLASNCAPTSSDHATVDILGGQRAVVLFDVACVMRQIAVSAQGSNLRPYQVYLMNRDGSNPVLLSTGAGSDYVDGWSPDGRTLLFTHVVNDNVDLWAMDATGDNRRPLTSTAGTEHGGSWSPDGSRIAFHAAPPSGFSQIAVMNADGSDQQLLTTDPWYNIYPRWSPDGTQLVFTSIRGSQGFVETMLADGTNRRALTPSSLAAMQPTWSPDGGRIAFVVVPPPFKGLVSEIYVMNADGTGLRQLTQGANVGGFLDWSPDGQSIVFPQQFDPMRLAIYSFRDGSLKTIATSFTYSTPVWRP